MENKILEFLTLWKELENNNIEVIFSDGLAHPLEEVVEICWNNENETISYNP